MNNTVSIKIPNNRCSHPITKGNSGIFEQTVVTCNSCFGSSEKIVCFYCSVNCHDEHIINDENRNIIKEKITYNLKTNAEDGI